MFLSNMYKLYHHPICPLSRQIRVYLKELNTEFGLVKEEYWIRRQEFVDMNPAGTLPVLESKDQNLCIIGIYPIVEYMIDTIPEFRFMPISDHRLKSQIRQHFFWFNDKFYREVTKILIDEKMVRLLMRVGGPRIEFIKAAKQNLTQHLRYLSSLLDKNPYIASEQISCADIAAACHISTIDYFGEMNWDSWPQIRHWYSLIKSRPGFRPLLQDYIAGFTPSKEYSDLDF